MTANAKRPVSAFFSGWFFGFGYFLLGLYWVGNALLVEGNPYKWAWLLAVCGLPFILAFFPAFACLLARRFTIIKSLSGFLAFCAFAALFEWARGHVFTGFPWNLYGHAWTSFLPMLQILSLSDVYFLTALTVLWCAAPGFFIAGESPGAKKMLLGICLGAAFLANLGFGMWRLSQPLPPREKSFDIRIAQANIPQSEKWSRDKAWAHFLKRIELSAKSPFSSASPVYVIWPETALSQNLLNDPKAFSLIKEMLGRYNVPAYLLTGLLRYESDTGRIYNSAVLIDKNGAVSNIYDKNHLVPFGEYIPFQKWIPLEPVARFRGFSGEGKAQTFSTPEGLKYSPLICYEIIFSGEVANPDNHPSVLINLTNDSWYGVSAGPFQHLSQAVFRAIEEGVPVVRVADTGISAAIDPYGKIVEKSGLYEEYEKTLALPPEIVLSIRNRAVKKSAFWFLIIVFVALGFAYRNLDLTA